MYIRIHTYLYAYACEYNRAELEVLSRVRDWIGAEVRAYTYPSIYLSICIYIYALMYMHIQMSTTRPSWVDPIYMYMHMHIYTYLYAYTYEYNTAELEVLSRARDWIGAEVRAYTYPSIYLSTCIYIYALMYMHIQMSTTRPSWVDPIYMYMHMHIYTYLYAYAYEYNAAELEVLSRVRDWIGAEVRVNTYLSIYPSICIYIHA